MLETKPVDIKNFGSERQREGAVISHTTGIVILESTVVAETIGTSKYTWWIVTGNVCGTIQKFYRNRGNLTENMAYTTIKIHLPTIENIYLLFSSYLSNPNF